MEWSKQLILAIKQQTTLNISLLIRQNKEKLLKYQYFKRTKMKLLQNKKLTIIMLLAVVCLGILGFAYYRHKAKYDYEINQVLNYENKIVVPSQKKLTNQNTNIVIYDDSAENQHLIGISFKYSNGNQANAKKIQYLKNSPDDIAMLKIVYTKR